jgi:hypothetical protein
MNCEVDDLCERVAFPLTLPAYSLSNLPRDKKPLRRNSWKWRYYRPTAAS